MHTQGQWEVATINCGEDNNEIVTEVNGCLVNIAEIFGEGSFSEAMPGGEDEPHYEVSKEEAESNARLIAASPDLLEACKKMLVCIGGDPRFYAEEKYAVEALKKAGTKKFGKFI